MQRMMQSTFSTLDVRPFVKAPREAVAASSNC